jgi:hypothetical protein
MGMRSTVLILAPMAVAVLLASVVALALPSETPDNTPMLNGPVRTFAQVGDNIWVGGSFTQVEQRNGTVIDDVSNVAVFDSETNEYVDMAPMLGVQGSEVWDMTVYDNDVVIAGDFVDPSAEGENLVVVDGGTGAVIRWYDSKVLRSALAVPELGRIYGGGKSLTVFDFATGEKLWSRVTTIIDQSIRWYGVRAAYRDLELDTSTLSPDGNATIWAACACDAVEGNTAKALVKLDTEGNHDASWVSQGEPEAFGISLVDPGNGTLYLGAGGNDFLAAYPKADSGERAWSRDTSGSAQVVEEMEGGLVVGGHFWEVADQADDDCGHRSLANDLTLDPNDECQTRHGLATYSFDGTLELSWSPKLAGKYMLTWALHPEAATSRLYVGGEFTHVNGIRQEYYTRLSSELLP